MKNFEYAEIMADSDKNLEKSAKDVSSVCGIVCVYVAIDRLT